MNKREILYEAAVKKMSATDTVIYSDKTPKSLYEYYYYKYKESDIQKLVENIRMSFETWDKIYNLYKTSEAINKISSDDVAVLYEDYVGNLFIYSFATNKIYYYDKDKEPYLDIKYPMTIKDFLDVSKRDFEALGRTPYGKKFVTESAVLMEGIREVFGYGTAIRIFIDGKMNEDARVYDKHSFAFIDALTRYSKKLMTYHEFENACARAQTKIEIYTNRKLGRRDVEDRSNQAMPTALEEERVDSLDNLMKKYSIDKERLWINYTTVKTMMIQIESANEYINKFLKKDTAIRTAYDGSNAYWWLKRSVLLGGDACEIFSFDVGKYYKAFVASARSRLDVLSPSVIVTKFEVMMDQLCKSLNSFTKNSDYLFFYAFDGTESQIKSNARGNCWIYLGSKYLKEDPYFSDSGYYEYLTGRNTKLFNKHFVKEEFLDKFYDADITEEEYLNYLNSVDQATLEAGIYAVLEREETRDLAHKLRAGAEKVGKVVGDAARKAKDVFMPLMRKIRGVIDGAQKGNEDDIREEIITDSTFIKLRNLFKSALLPIGAYYVAGPAAAITTFFVQRALKTDDEKIRSKIIRELEVELKLTREKIEDAKGDNARKQKYELMRLESKIEDELARIKYGKKD